MEKGKLITIYGANNLGKTTQNRLLGQKLISEGKQILSVKYAIYGLEPTGPLINNILRHPEKLDRKYDDKELQTIYAQNRRDFQPTITTLLDAGVSVISEDYSGTGIAWGLTKDVELDYLLEINSDLLEPEAAILLDGERFTSAVERNHRHEAAGDDVWQKNREIHMELAERFNWNIVNANQTPQKVASDIWEIVNVLYQ